MTPGPPAATWPPILIAPGLFNSPPEHWQSHWERTLPGAERVEQENWDLPTLGEWTAGLLEAVRRRLVEEGHGAELDAFACRRAGRRGRILEPGVGSESGAGRI